jgi:heavy metal translocating P-type ATPase
MDSMTIEPCSLCGLPVGRAGVLEKCGGTQHHFCCYGCRQVYFILSNLPGGLPRDFRQTELFRLCETSGLIGPNLNDRNKKKGFPAKSDPTASPTEEVEDGLTRELVLKVEGLWCSTCSWLIEEVLSRLKGVLEVKALYTLDLVQFKYLPQEVTIQDIQDRLSKLGYHFSSFQDPSKPSGERKRLQLRLGLSSILTAHVMMISFILYAGFFQDLGAEATHYFSYSLWILTTPVLLYGGWPVFKKAWIGLRYGNPSMEFLISIGALSAYFYSLFQMSRASLHLYFDTSAMLIVLVLLGKYLEARAKERISGGLMELVLLAGQKVRLLTEEGEKWLPSAEIRPGDAFQVLAGERISVDGRIVFGQAHLDESVITGESRPIKKGLNDEVRAGSLVLDDQLTIQATRVGAESSLGQIITLVQEGLARKTAFELLADSLSRWVIPLILGLSLGTAFYLIRHNYSLEDSLLRALTILVISCPCALGIAVPLAKVASVGKGRAEGFLIRDPAALEKIRKLDILIFDKTGTLTEGRYALQEMVCLECAEEEALQKIASLEAFSEHFLARAIQDKAREIALPLKKITNFQTVSGLGVKGLVDGSAVLIGNRTMMTAHGLHIPDRMDPLVESQERRGSTIVYFGWEGQFRGFMAFRDVLKKTARQTLSELHQRSFQTRMVSGDSFGTTRVIAEELGIESFIGQALPQDKVDLIKKLQKEGHRVGMIGDGINDAAALAQADVGFALGIKTGILKDASDITLLTDDPLTILKVLELSKLTLTIIHQNLGLAFFYNILGIPLAMTGRLNPLIAAVAMFASSLTVIGNSMRLYRSGANVAEASNPRR